MTNLREGIEATAVSSGGVALWWLAQAGFALKSSAGAVLYADPYLSNVVERAFGFKRLSLAPIDAQDVRADWVISSHEHLDHLDTDALPVIARNNPQCRFAGPDSCAPEYERCGIPADRCLIMSPGNTYQAGDVTIHTTQADHGELSPSALSLLLDFGKVRALFTGDTALRLPWIQPLINRKPTIFLTCINGRYGNLNPVEAAQLARAVNPKIVIPCHFWMFKEHNGDPESFVQACAELCPDVQLKILSPGEGIEVSDDV